MDICGSPLTSLNFLYFYFYRALQFFSVLTLKKNTKYFFKRHLCFTLILFSEHKWNRETQMKVTLIILSLQNLVYYLFQNPFFFQHSLSIIHAYLKEIGKEHMVTEILD